MNLEETMNSTFLVRVIGALAVVGPLAFVVADDDDDRGQKQSKKIERKVVVRAEASAGGKKSATKTSFLGVGVDPAPSVLAAQLPDAIAKGQGLVVTQVVADSPAAQAGVREDDVLLNYDDQKLFSVEQLHKLVRSDKPGREVVLAVLRGGKVEKIKAKIGEHDEAPTADVVRLWDGGTGVELKAAEKLLGEHLKELDGKNPVRLEIRKRLEDKAAAGSAGAKVKSRTGAMTMRSLDGDRFHAEIEFKDEDGKSKNWSFEGTRDEIRKELESNKELPNDLREHMLRSLDLSSGKGGRGGAKRLVLPGGSGIVSIDGDWGDAHVIHLDLTRSLNEVLEGLPDEIGALVREQLRSSLRGTDKPQNREDTKSPTIEEGDK
jgi:membrane-associated protease RseP (regulator of RpoE activity)